QLGEAALELGVFADGHQVGQDGTGGVEADGLAGGRPGQAGDLVGRGGGVPAQVPDGAVDGAASDRLDLVEDLGGSTPGVGGPLGDAVLLGPGADGLSAGHRQGEGGLLVPVVPLYYYPGKKVGRAFQPDAP